MNIPSLITTVVLSFAWVQNTVADAELERLQASYNGAVERAVAPLRDTYEKELLKLMEKHTKAGNLDAALEVKVELEQLTGKTLGSKSGSAETTKAGDKIFIDKTWKTPTGTNFTFNQDGTGTRQFGNDMTTFKWKLRGKDTVEATGPGNQSGNETTWYFRFHSLGEAYYGNNRDSVNNPVELKR